MKYRKKPVVIEAIRYFEFDGIDNIKEFVGDSLRKDYEAWVILTLEGAMTIRHGDFVIKGVAGEFYSCRPDIFLATYELVEEV